MSVDYAELPATVDAAATWPEVPDNRCFAVEMGDRAATEAAFAAAHHVARLALYNNRIAAVSMEPRGAVGEYTPPTTATGSI